MTIPSSETTDPLAGRTRGLRGQSLEEQLSVPEVLDGLSASIQSAFLRDWGKSQHRRPKCSKQDFAAGYRTCLEAHWLKGRKRRPPEPPEGLVE